MSNSVDEILSRKREIEKAIADARAELRATGGKFLVGHFAPLFVKYPDIKGLRWRAYTPYFNDGDACEFSSRHQDANVLFGDDPDDLTDLDDGKESDWEKYKDAQVEFQAHFPELTDDDMEALFGDHVEVTLYPDRIETEEYSHD